MLPVKNNMCFVIKDKHDFYSVDFLIELHVEYNISYSDTKSILLCLELAFKDSDLLDRGCQTKG